MLDARDYTIGWICALQTENLAAKIFLDEEHGQPKWRSPNDTNSYLLGTMGRHNVVIGVLPMGEYGTASAAGVAINMLRSFPNVKIGLMVGIGGGAPSLPDRDIRLGDVVEKKFQHTRSLDQPPQALLTALAGLKTHHEVQGNRLLEMVNEVLESRPRLKRKYGRPLPDTDVLFESGFIHAGGSCASCCGQDSKNVIRRPTREPDIDDNPAVHYGTIASGNTLMKDALLRDTLADQKNVLCFDMEAAGLMNRFPCLIIRGICDYSDSHKSKEWQGFAAMAAAAYAKDLICYLAPELVQAEQKLSSILLDIQEATTETKIIVQGIESQQNAREKQAILDWIIDTSFGAQQSDILARRQPGTCQWLLDSVEYHNWVENGSQILYCPGIPGSGKTVVSSIVIHDLETRFAADTTVGLAHIYCNFKNQQNQDIRMLVASVLKQLCQRRPGIPDVVRSLHDQYRRLQTKPRIEELSQAMETVSALFQRIYLVVDGLDEWKEIEADRALMLRELLCIQAKTGLNLLATSRPVLDIIKTLHRYPSVEISASRADVALYIDGHQHMLPGFVGETPGLLNKIKDALSEASQGMFLIAQLSLEWLKTEISIRDLEATLSQFLERSKLNDLDQFLCKAYDETMERIVEQNRRHVDLARKVLSWVTFAVKDLTVIEVQHALALREGDAELNVKGISDAGLIVSSPDGLGQTALGWACIGGHEAIVEFLLLRLMAMEESGIDGQDHFYQNTPLHLAACGGHSANIEVLLKHGARPDAKDSSGITPLMAGIFCNHSDALIPLLNAIGNLEQQVAYAEDQNLLPLAGRAGNFEFVRILLDKGVDVDRRGENGNTGLLQAVEEPNNLAAVKLFVDKGANLDLQDKEGQTALMIAVWKWSEDIVWLLLKRRANLDLQDKKGQTALMIAVLRDSKNIIWFPLKHAADLSLENDCGERTLFKECRSIQMSELPNNIIKILLEAGADINVEDNLGRTALMIAIENENYIAAGLLIERGGNVDFQDDRGQTLLMKAIQADNQITSGMFIEGSRNLNLQDEGRKTALDYAFEKWFDLNGDHCEAIRRLLLEKGAKANLYPEAMDLSFKYPSLIPW
ncbi:hypothetical protein ACJZ2D_011817 [Fusarium nematophilum]